MYSLVFGTRVNALFSHVSTRVVGALRTRNKNLGTERYSNKDSGKMHPISENI